MKILSYIISNNENERYKNELDLISVLNCRSCSFETIKISKQPNLNYSAIFSLFMHFYLLIIKIRYRYKRKLKKNYINIPKIKLEKQISTSVTFKHIQGLQQAFQSNSDFVLVLENDAIPNNNASDQLENLLNNLKNINSSELIYVDMAGGISDELLLIKKIDKKNGIEKIIPPTTNTACAYLINYTFLKFLIDFINNKFFIRYIPIDWLLNEFMESNFNDKKINCFRTSIKIFSHGSSLGKMDSWQK